MTNMLRSLRSSTRWIGFRFRLRTGGPAKCLEPQLGHAAALSETACPQSEQLMSF